MINLLRTPFDSDRPLMLACLLSSRLLEAHGGANPLNEWPDPTLIWLGFSYARTFG